VTGDPHVRFYAGYPLHAPGGERVGALCIVDDRPRSLDDDEVVLLPDLAAWVEKELAADEALSPAARLQRELFPRTPPEIAGYEVTGSCLPAHEVGGDFYDWYAVGDALQLVLGDVMGKGLPAAAIAAAVRSALRESCEGTLAEGVTRAAGLVEPELDRAGTFVTLFCARLQPATGEVAYVDAGHGLAAVLDTDGGYRPLVSDDLPMGADPEYRWTEQRAVLEPHETLVGISDGYLDFFRSPEEAVAAALGANARVSSAAALMHELTSFATARNAPDDVTALVVRRTGG
jgi:serine phosphatase RsbU (regulator of sigma subunit)